MTNQSIYQITVVLEITFQKSLIEAYNIVERTVRLSNKTTFRPKTLIIFADNIALIKEVI